MKTLLEHMATQPMRIILAILLLLLCGCDTITDHLREKRLEKVGPSSLSPREFHRDRYQ